jgi:hypothetical protein
MADAIKRAKGGKKNRKYGRNARRCEIYRSTHQRERNKVVRLKKHLSRFPGDVLAEAKLADLHTLLGIGVRKAA